MAYTTIDDGSAHFHTQLYTGNGSADRDITNDANAGDFKPDFLWIKTRSLSGNNHHLFNSNVGMPNHLSSDLTDGEQTATNKATAFNTDGFRVQTHSSVNQSSATYVAWQWKANGSTTSSNTDGSITSTVQANTTAGFSIVTYTSAAGGQTIGHGLGVVPEMYIIKERTTSGDDWFVYHSGIGAGKKLRLSANSAAESDTNIWQNTAPTTTVAYLQNDGGGVNQNTGGNQNYVAYFFNSVQGYSKIGSYTGNGANDGPFVYLGFKPAWLLIKISSGHNESWHIWDNKRVLGGGNPNQAALTPNTTGADTEDSTPYNIDFLSNGFKIREDHDITNGSGDSYIYMAFAEHPFVSSKGVPVTAI